MVRRVPFLRAAVAALGLLFGVATQAHAGLDFTDEVTVSVATPGTTFFNGLPSAAFNTSGPAGAPWQLGQHAGGGPVMITDTAAPGSSLTATLNFAYNPALSGVSVVDYNTTNNYNFYIAISSITSGTTGPPAGFSLASIAVVDALAGPSLPAGPAGGTPLGLPPSGAPTLLHLQIPAAGAPVGIPALSRTQVTTVALTFTWTGGVGNVLVIDAVANPEPSTLALFGLGMLGLGAGIVRRRRVSRAAAAA